MHVFHTRSQTADVSICKPNSSTLRVLCLCSPRFGAPLVLKGWVVCWQQPLTPSHSGDSHEARKGSGPHRRRGGQHGRPSQERRAQAWPLARRAGSWKPPSQVPPKARRTCGRLLGLSLPEFLEADSASPWVCGHHHHHWGSDGGSISLQVTTVNPLPPEYLEQFLSSGPNLDRYRKESPGACWEQSPNPRGDAARGREQAGRWRARLVRMERLAAEDCLQRLCLRRPCPLRLSAQGSSRKTGRGEHSWPPDKRSPDRREHRGDGLLSKQKRKVREKPRKQTLHWVGKASVVQIRGGEDQKNSTESSCETRQVNKRLSLAPRSLESQEGSQSPPHPGTCLRQQGDWCRLRQQGTTEIRGSRGTRERTLSVDLTSSRQVGNLVNKPGPKGAHRLQVPKPHQRRTGF